MSRVPAALVVMATLAMSAAGQSQTADLHTDLQTLLPNAAAVVPWKPAGPPARYDRSTLSNFIDGAAERYLSYGFSRAITQEYARGDETVSCTIYHMTSPEAAQGIFSHGLSPQKERLAIGDAAARSGFQLTFRQDRYYTVVETFASGPEANRLLETFATAISANIREALAGKHAP